MDPGTKPLFFLAAGSAHRCPRSLCTPGWISCVGSGSLSHSKWRLSQIWSLQPEHQRTHLQLYNSNWLILSCSLRSDAWSPTLERSGWVFPAQAGFSCLGLRNELKRLTKRNFGHQWSMLINPSAWQSFGRNCGINIAIMTPHSDVTMATSIAPLA